MIPPCRVPRAGRAPGPPGIPGQPGAAARARPAEPGRAGRRRQSTPAGRRLRHRGRGQLCALSAPLPPVRRPRHQSAPTLGAMGLPAGGPVRQARTSAAHGGLLRRRRLLPDEHAGTRRRPAVPPGRRGAGVQQRHVGHHPRTRNASFPAVRSRWASRIPISRRSRAATVATANRDAHRGLRRRASSARAGLCRARTPARCWTSATTPTASRPARPCRPSATPPWRARPLPHS